MTADIEKRLSALEDRIQLLDILQLEGEYCRAWDFGNGEQWASLFAEDGVFEMRAAVNVGPLPGGQPATIRGQQALAQFRDAFSKGWFMLHQMHLPSCRIDGNKAQAVIFFECPIKASDTDGRAAISREIGIYKVHYQRSAEGWKIARRIEQAIFRDSLFHFGWSDLDTRLA